MKTPQKTLLIFAIATTLCTLLVAVVSAEPVAPNGPVIISKTVSPQIIDLNYSGVLTYTITMTNTATPAIQNAFMQDTLPTLLSFNAWVQQPTVGTITRTGNTILWTGPLASPPSGGTPPGSSYVLTFTFTVNLPGPESMTLLLDDGKIVNTASAGRMDGTLYIIEDSDTAITRIRRYIYLPLVMRNFTQ